MNIVSVAVYVQKTVNLLLPESQFRKIRIEKNGKQINVICAEDGKRGLHALNTVLSDVSVSLRILYLQKGAAYPALYRNSQNLQNNIFEVTFDMQGGMNMPNYSLSDILDNPDNTQHLYGYSGKIIKKSPF